MKYILTISTTIAFATFTVAAQPKLLATYEAAKQTASGQRAVYAAEYKILKEDLLGKDGEEMGQTETLEALAVKFSQALEKTEKRFARLEVRVKTLEDQARTMEQWRQNATAYMEKLEKRIKTLETRTNAIDGDLDKLYNWADKTDVELHNEYSIDGICAKVAKLDKYVNNVEAQIEKMRIVIDCWRTRNRRARPKCWRR